MTIFCILQDLIGLGRPRVRGSSYGTDRYKEPTCKLEPLILQTFSYNHYLEHALHFHVEFANKNVSLQSVPPICCSHCKETF